MPAKNKSSFLDIFGRYLGDAVYGALDGTVTTFAIIAGSIGAGLTGPYVVILGLANLFADGFSMATGSYMSQKSHRDYLKKQKRKIELLIENKPKEALNQLKKIYQQKGFYGFELDSVINVVASQPELWAQELNDRRGLNQEKTSPLFAGLVTFIAFIFVGSMPVIIYVVLGTASYIHILQLVAIVLFIVGSLRSKITQIPWWRGGLEVMLAGTFASLIAYGIGELLSSIFMNGM